MRKNTRNYMQFFEKIIPKIVTWKFSFFFLCSKWFFFFFVIQNFGQIRVGNSRHVQIFHVHWKILQTYHVQFMINKCWIWVNICLVHFKNRLKSTFLCNFCLHYSTKRLIKESSSLKKISFNKSVEGSRLQVWRYFSELGIYYSVGKKSTSKYWF